MNEGLLEIQGDLTLPQALRRPVRMPQRAQVQCALSRVRVAGKFLQVGDVKLPVRGVTYGPFAPDADGCQYGSRAAVAHDFAEMRAAGLNAVRAYTVPPRWLLDLAHEAGLYVMVGLPWEQHITFLDGRRRRRDIIQRIGHAVASSAGHPAVLCYAIGNEIPAPIVRWYGPQRVERWLAQLYDVVKRRDQDALVTYVNYPSTEYLNLPFLDLVAFNVYLECPDALRRYLARLQNIAGDRPLLMAEVGLDSLRNGEQRQAETLDWQIRTAQSCGCAGAFIFSWTDQWHRGGQDILDWQFGLTDRNRQPKPALDAVRRAFLTTTVAQRAQPAPAPKISVIVCTYNGSRTLAECLSAASRIDYPNYEVIVVDDGSTDNSAEIASKFDVHLIRIANGGLSNARNVGLHAATGEIVAYLDDDAYPDSQWLTFLAETFTSGDHAGIGGPNIPPHSDPPLADCVAHAPGGPTHVLLTDTVAEHIPGCNMAFRRDRLLAVGGFDTQFRIAGDDVDLCWRLQERGWTLGFSPAAVVWHHRRGSVRAYLKQQLNYGRAEAMLERKWPGKYNAAGHMIWSGRLYGTGYLFDRLPWNRRRIYHGTWGTAPFQSVYHPAPSLLHALPVMPEWYVLTALLAAVSVLGILFKPLLWAAPLAGAMLLTTIISAIIAGSHAAINQHARSWPQRIKYRAIVILLHMLQPVVRLVGRFHYGLTPWRLRGVSGFAFPLPCASTIWSEPWKSAEQRLAQIEARLRAANAVVSRGGDFDRWDLHLRGGMFGGALLHMTVEEHGQGRQLVRFRACPHWCVPCLLVPTALAGAAIAGLMQGTTVLAIAAALLSLLLFAVSVRETSAALATLRRALRTAPTEDRHDD